VVTSELIEEYGRDGIVCLRGLLDDGWVERMRQATDRVLANPTPLAADLTGDAEGKFSSDRFTWMYDDDFKAFCLESPAARVAAEVMESETAVVFRNEILVKEPGTTARTPWHQDQPYYPLRGRQMCTVWVALDPVTDDTGGVEYIAGSHNWGRAFRPEQFGNAPAPAQNIPMETIPAIDSQRDEYTFKSYAMDPGDALVFQGMIVHGAGGNASQQVRRRAINVRFTGDDVTWTPIENYQLPADPGLHEGDHITSDVFPQAWPPVAEPATA
jgi:ectoine hydroxylase-related dioxygenase (phytanoyl-CoA dioxygenase family)